MKIFLATEKVFVANTHDTIQFSKISSDESDQEAAFVFLHEGNSPSLLFWEPMKLGDATTIEFSVSVVYSLLEGR